MNHDLRLIFFLWICMYVQPCAQSLVLLEDCGVSYIDPQDQSTNGSTGRDTLVFTTTFESDQLLRAYYIDINAFGGQQIDRTKVFAIMPDNEEKLLGELAFGNCFSCSEGFAFVYNDSLYVQNEKDRDVIDLWLRSFNQPQFALQGSLQTLVGAGRLSGNIPFCATGLKVQYVVNSNPANATTEFSTHIICPEVIKDCTINKQLIVDCPNDSFALKAIVPDQCFAANTDIFWETPNGMRINAEEVNLRLTGNEGWYQLFIQDECCVQIDSVLVENPSFAQAGSNLEVCQGASFTIEGNGGVDHFWTLPNNETIDDSLGIFSGADAANAGLYILHAFDDAGCEDLDTLIVQVRPPVEPEVSFSDACLGDTLILNLLNDTSFNQVIWRNPLEEELLEPTIKDLHPDLFGEYSVETVDLNGCATTSYFDVAGSHPPAFESVVEESCDSTRVFLLPDTLQYHWNNGVEGNTFISATGGLFQVTITDANGCSTSDFVDLPPPDGPNFDLKIEQPKCPGDYGAIAILPQDVNRPMIFSIDGGSHYNLKTEFRELDPGAYEVIVQDDLGCTFQAVVEIERPDTMGVTLDLEYLEVRPNQSIQLNAKTIGNIQEFQWLPNEINTEGPTTEFVAQHNMDVRVIVKDMNGCHAVDGFQLTVILSPISAPNAFSPNSDGRNDRFTFYSDQLSGEVIEILRVFDRFGNLMFQTSEIPLNNETYGWDGLNQGQPATSGVYTYYGKIRYGNGIKKIVKGDVALIR